MKGLHELFQPWKDEIFNNDPTLRKKIIEILEEKEQDENNTD